MFYQNPELIEKFANENYKKAKELYYNVVWNWLPKETQKEIKEN
ncbi:hypothetical protein LEP1GSC062_2090 [Leptospira alexanderi serovar Manhao 3 str. L 60]|uniref:Uncharacterized protein n=1 Tax=Leptospira alexanderi serovar Manhao 3 str. L 60 TaxID=1049759 RepID=V6HYC0_9LEPT|nr:hypothetical protein LEP1GSC062_2090 [Leptospira alexanderi serovar Manhao 3 str. L 60]